MVAGLLPVAVVAAFVLVRIGQDPLVGADYSLLELGTRSVWRGDALLGPYSRFRWNHPGPALWYWNAPFYAVTGQRAGGLSLAAVVLNGLGLGWSVVAVFRSSGRAAAWAAAMVVLVFISQTGTSWLDQPWNPLLVITPLIVAGIATAGVVAGRSGHLVITVVAASFAVQTHIGTAPIVGAFALVAVVAATVHIVLGWRTWWPSAAGAILAGGVMWSLPVAQQLTSEPGNMGMLLQYSRGPRGRHGLGEVFNVVGADLTLVHRNLIYELLIGGGDLPPAASGWHLVVIAGLLVTAAVAVGINLRAGRWFVAGVGGVALLGTGAQVFALTRLNDRLYPYLTVSAVSLGLLLYLSIALTLVPEVGLRIVGRLDRRSPGVAAAVALGVALLVGAQAVTADHTAFPFARLVGDDSTTSALAEITRALPENGTVHVAMVDPSTWGPGALVVNRLERDGRTVTVDDRWEFMFGPQRGPAGCPEVVVTIYDLNPARRSEDPQPAPVTLVRTTVGDSLVTVSRMPALATCPG